jgi:hypothetical protein
MQAPQRVRRSSSADENSVIKLTKKETVVLKVATEKYSTFSQKEFLVEIRAILMPLVEGLFFENVFIRTYADQKKGHGYTYQVHASGTIGGIKNKKLMAFSVNFDLAGDDELIVK